MKIKNEDLCACGHTYLGHFDSITDIYLNGQLEEGCDNPPPRHCMKFQLDNLKYLEQIYENNNRRK